MKWKVKQSDTLTEQDIRDALKTIKHYEEWHYIERVYPFGIIYEAAEQMYKEIRKVAGRSPKGKKGK